MFHSMRRLVMTTTLTTRSRCCRHVQRFNTTDNTKNNNIAAQAQEQHANIMEAKAQRAAQLHAELEEMLLQNEKRRKETSGFLNFLKQNSSQFGSIGLSFLLVIFAYQIVGMKQAARNLQATLEEKELELKQERQVIQSLQTTEFAEKVASKCNTNNSSSRGFWKGNNNTELAPILLQELKNHIGDAGLTLEEKKEKKVAQLQQTQETPQDALLNELNKVQIVDKDDGETVIKRQRFSI